MAIHAWTRGTHWAAHEGLDVYTLCANHTVGYNSTATFVSFLGSDVGAFEQQLSCFLRQVQGDSKANFVDTIVVHLVLTFSHTAHTPSFAATTSSPFIVIVVCSDPSVHPIDPTSKGRLITPTIPSYLTIFFTLFLTHSLTHTLSPRSCNQHHRAGTLMNIVSCVGRVDLAIYMDDLSAMVEVRQNNRAPYIIRWLL
ncbi:hypothetical protein B0O80DRAFT_422894 [Mortierella sp. GBAus27b]|nr:hypothetical protein B0O80DRAFT_422894 [Mortierella sp. GBAus27b]